MGARAAASWIHSAQRLTRHPHAARETLLQFQSQRLRQLVQYAYAHVPFYQRLYGSLGIEPEDIRGLADLHTLPVIGKRDLRAAGGDTLGDDVDPTALVVYRTSGSTGQPFAIRRTRAEDRLLHLFRRRARRLLGLRARDRLVHVAEPDADGHGRARWGQIERALRRYRSDLTSCLEPPETIARQLDRRRPDVVVGFPDNLARIARLLSPERFPGIRPRMVWTGGEPLTPRLRRRIEAGFAAPAYDLYGAHEFNLLAWECPHSGALHVCDDNLILEVLKDGEPVAPGERGEVVTTGLHSLAMPLIRYRMGDLATRGPASCECGQPFSTLQDVQGRTVHVLRLADGRELHPYQITGPLIAREGDWIDQHQLVQLGSGDLELRVRALDAPLEPACLDRLKALGRAALGPDTRFRVTLVDAFPPDPSGKFQPYVSLLESAQA